MSAAGFPGFLRVLSRSIVDPSPRLSAGVALKTSCGFKILPKVRIVLAIFGVV